MILKDLLSKISNQRITIICDNGEDFDGFPIVFDSVYRDIDSLGLSLDFVNNPSLILREVSEIIPRIKNDEPSITIWI